MGVQGKPGTVAMSPLTPANHAYGVKLYCQWTLSFISSAAWVTGIVVIKILLVNTIIFESKFIIGSFVVWVSRIFPRLFVTSAPYLSFMLI
mgnify:CR=1 FL=1